ncbi:surfactant protein C-like [Gastrophryne carolinensis]
MSSLPPLESLNSDAKLPPSQCGSERCDPSRINILPFLCRLAGSATMVTVAFASADGEKVVQTVSVNEREEVGVIYVRSDKYSGTYLFDYRRTIISIRKPNSTTCYILRMEDKTPPLSALVKGVEYFRTHDASANDQIAFNVTRGEEADPAEVGTNVYLMCSDAVIYWAKRVTSTSQNRFWEFEVNLGIVRFKVGG